jgi:hypothetical protein
MSTAFNVCDVVIEYIRVFWRTHDETGLLPRWKQEWWFELCDNQGGQCFLALSDWVKSDVLSAAEAVVDIASQNGITIGVEQVQINTRKNEASWKKGAWEAFVDAC